MYSYKWRPSAAQKKEYAQQMQKIEAFCWEHEISQSQRGDSYYFTINGSKYRVSNHTVEASNRGAFREDALTGETVQTRSLYHNGREADTIYIHASKTRIIQIYNDLAAGYTLDGKGNRKI